MHSDDDRPVIPAGMVAWGPDSPGYPNAPVDWDGGPVLFANGKLFGASKGHVWKLGWSHSYGNGNVVAYTPTRFDGFARILPDAPEAAGGVTAGERWQHVKRGTVYEVLGVATIQNATSAFLYDDIPVAVYRGEDGKLWVRRVGEFTDGRFTRLASAPEPRAVGTSDEREVREALFDALHVMERLRDLTPIRANETTADGLHGAVSAIVKAALDRLTPALGTAS